jgi:hypothetical protein
MFLSTEGLFQPPAASPDLSLLVLSFHRLSRPPALTSTHQRCVPSLSHLSQPPPLVLTPQLSRSIPHRSFRAAPASLTSPPLRNSTHVPTTGHLSQPPTTCFELPPPPSIPTTHFSSPKAYSYPSHVSRPSHSLFCTAAASVNPPPHISPCLQSLPLLSPLTVSCKCVPQTKILPHPHSLLLSSIQFHPCLHLFISCPSC